MARITQRGFASLSRNQNLRRKTRFQQVVVRMNEERRSGRIRVISVIGGEKTVWFRPKAGLGNLWLF